MSVYAKTDTKELIKILNEFLRETPALLRDGFTEIANQNWLVINALWDELETREDYR